MAVWAVREDKRQVQLCARYNSWNFVFFLKPLEKVFQFRSAIYHHKVIKRKRSRTDITKWLIIFMSCLRDIPASEGRWLWDWPSQGWVHPIPDLEKPQNIIFSIWIYFQIIHQYWYNRNLSRIILFLNLS